MEGEGGFIDILSPKGLELRYQAEFLRQDLLSKVLGYVFLFDMQLHGHPHTRKMKDLLRG